MIEYESKFLNFPGQQRRADITRTPFLLLPAVWMNRKQQFIRG